VRFGFTLFDDRGDPTQDFVFSHLHGDDGPGVVTSSDLQGLTAQKVGDQGATSLLEVSDARLVTVSDPEAPPTIPQAEWPVRLFLGGFRFAESG
jgi:hypothetical protein